MPNELVQQWIKKAEEDWTGIKRLKTGGLSDITDLISFLSQQCAEKYLKALIQNEDTEPPRLHHLTVLLDLLLEVHPDLENLRASCEQLTPYAVGFRYPGEEATTEDAEMAIQLAQKIRNVIRDKLKT